MHNNKITGIIKSISVSNGEILLSTSDNPEGLWWKGIGDRAKVLVSTIIKGIEVDLSIVNIKKQTFSYLAITKQNVQAKRNERKGGNKPLSSFFGGNKE